MSGPLTLVLDAFATGAGSLAVVEASTGLPRDVVEASVSHLLRTGRLEATELAVGCPVSGCGSCAAAAMDGTPCATGGPGPGRRGRTLVALRLPSRV